MLTSLDTHRETARLRSLAASGLTAGCMNRELRRVMRYTRDSFAVPTVLLSAVHESVQFFPARIGLQTAQTARECSFCAHILSGADHLLVPDASQDARFQSNCLVTGEPHVRFYAGVAVRLQDGSRMGAYCLVDSRPRPDLGEPELARLREIAGFVQLITQAHVIRRAA